MSNQGYFACRSDNQLHWPTRCLEVMCDYMLSSAGSQRKEFVVLFVKIEIVNCTAYCVASKNPDVCIFILQSSILVLWSTIIILSILVHWEATGFQDIRIVSYHMHKKNVNGAAVLITAINYKNVIRREPLRTITIMIVTKYNLHKQEYHINFLKNICIYTDQA